MTSLFRLWWIAKDIYFPIGTSTHSRADKRKLATQMLSDLAPADCRALRTLLKASAYDESRLGAIQGLLRLPNDCDIRLAVPVLYDFAFSDSYFSITVAWTLFYRGVLNESQKEKIWQVIVDNVEESVRKDMASDGEEGRARAERWRELKALANELRRGSIPSSKLNELGINVADDEPLKAGVYFLAADSLNPGDRLALSNLQWLKKREERIDDELLGERYHGYSGIDRVRIMCGFTTSNESKASSDSAGHGIATLYEVCERHRARYKPLEGDELFLRAVQELKLEGTSGAQAVAALMDELLAERCSELKDVLCAASHLSPDPRLRDALQRVIAAPSIVMSQPGKRFAPITAGNGKIGWGSDEGAMRTLASRALHALGG